MNHRWAVPTGRRGVRVPAALVGLVVLTSAFVPTSAAASESRDVTVAIANADLSAGTKSWAANSGAKLSVLRVSGPDVGQVKRTSKRTGTMYVRTASSAATLAPGDRVQVSATLRGTRTGGRTFIRVYETRSNGTVVQQQTDDPRKTSKSYGTRTVALTAREAGTRVKVRLYLDGARRGQGLRFKQVSSSIRPHVTPPTAAPGTPPTIPSPPAPTPTPVQPPPSTSPTPSPEPSPSAPPPVTPRAGPTYLANSRCESGSTGWLPSTNALAVPASETTTPATSCEVALRTGQSGTVTATSDVSTRTVPEADSRVHVASQVKATEAGRNLRMTLQEIGPTGSVVQSFTGQRASATSFGWVGAELRTRETGSRVRVVYTGETLSSGAAMRFTNTTVTVTAPETASQPPAPQPEPHPDPTPAPEPGPVPCSETDYSDRAQGKLTFNDEFDGTGIDTTKWRVRDGESLSFDAARILSRNVTVDDGLLTIRGKRETVGGRDWTTGYLDTIGKHAQKYGRWEMRAKIPTDDTMTRGVWPAFWLRSSSPGEIDIMEGYGSPSSYDRYSPSKRYEWTVWKYSTVPAGETNDRVMGHHVPATPPGQGFHTYAVDWSPECLRFSFDGKTTGVVPMDAKPWLATSFKDPFHIRLNMQVGSSYWGMPNDAETKPVFDYVVDHVRVYAPL